MNENNYECPKCHNVFPLANKIMHDSFCTEKSPVPLNKSRLVGKNNDKRDNKNKEPIQHRPQPKITTKRRPDSHINPLNVKESVMEVPKTFNCWLCGNTIPEKEREEHMELHQMEEENENFKKQKIEEKKKNLPPQDQRPPRPQQKNPPQRPPQQQRPPHGLQQQKPLQKPPQQPHFPPQQKTIHGPQQQRQQKPTHGPQEQKLPINIKRSFVPFESINIFDFNQVHETLNKKDNPTDADILAELPETEIGDISLLDPERRKCIICSVDLKSGEKATMLPCIHMFHSFCIQEWLRTKNFCPVCNYKLTNENMNF